MKKTNLIIIALIVIGITAVGNQAYAVHLSSVSTGQSNTFTQSQTFSNSVIANGGVTTSAGTDLTIGTNPAGNDRIVVNPGNNAAGDDVVINTDAGAGGINITAGVSAPVSPGDDDIDILATSDISIIATEAGILIETTANQDIVLDADDGTDGGTVLIEGDGIDSDILQLGSDTDPVRLQKTAANQLTITATDLVLSNNVIGAQELATTAFPTNSVHIENQNTETSYNLDLAITDNRTGTGQTIIVTATLQLINGDGAEDGPELTLSLLNGDAGNIAGDGGTLNGSDAANLIYTHPGNTVQVTSATWMITGANDSGGGNGTIDIRVAVSSIDSGDTVDMHVVGFALPA